MPAGGGRLLAALVLLALAAPAAAVEVCKVVDLQLVTQTGEFFLAGIARALVLPAHARVLSCAPVAARSRAQAARSSCRGCMRGAWLGAAHDSAHAWRADMRSGCVLRPCSSASPRLWCAVTFLGMGVTTVVFVLMAFKAAPEKRKFYFTTCYVTAISTFAYYAMLSGQGWLITPNCRQLFYVRYLEWFVTTPLILLDLGMIVGADMGLLAAVTGADMLMIFGGFMASISSGHIKWLWFVLSLMVFAPLVYVMIRGYRALVERSHPAVVEMYTKVSLLSAITWSLYPLVFIFSEGTGDWSPNFEIMMYGVLDILSKAVFGFILLLSHEGLDRITNFKSFAPIHEAPMSYGGVGNAPVESYI